MRAVGVATDSRTRMADESSSAPPRAIAPATAAQIRRLLALPDETGDDEIRREVAKQVHLVKAVLDLGFSTAFRHATLTGQVDSVERDFWREQFHDNPDRAREFLAQTWSRA